MYSCDTSKRHPRRGDTGREIAEKLGQTAVVEVLDALEAEAAAKAEAKAAKKRAQNKKKQQRRKEVKRQQKAQPQATLVLEGGER